MYMTNLIRCQEVEALTDARRIANYKKGSESVNAKSVNGLLPLTASYLHNEPRTGVHNEFAGHLGLNLFRRDAHLYFRR